MQLLYVKEVGSIYESGSGTIIPDLDPTWPKKALSDWIRIHFRNTGGCCVLRFLKVYICSCQTLQVFRNLSMLKQSNIVASSKEPTGGTEWKWWEPPSKNQRSEPARGETHNRNRIPPKRFYLDHRRTTHNSTYEILTLFYISLEIQGRFRIHTGI
jgi:hypothetical protein